MPNNIYSVFEINNYIKNMFDTDHFLSKVTVRGEIGSCKYNQTGHLYFTLKDAQSSISCVMFASKRASGLKFVLKDGMQVVISGSIEVFVRDGKYQLYASKIEQDGVGNLYEQFEQLKRRLEETGMFAREYKKAIPMFNKKIGVVTAATGAAIRDIIDVSKRRNPGVQIIIYPAIVQGELAPASIVEGIKALDAYGVDVMIVGRGGGSMEDLWCFNDERIAQAIFDCSTPIISAVGHEIDFTIADYVADLRAATPSAAAELAVCDIREYVNYIDAAGTRLKRDISGKIELERLRVSALKQKLERLSPQSKINEQRHRLAQLEDRLSVLMNMSIVNSRHRLELACGKLHGLSPLNKLGGGYAFVESGNGPIRSVNELKRDDTISISFKDGKARAQITDIAD